MWLPSGTISAPAPLNVAPASTLMLLFSSRRLPLSVVVLPFSNVRNVLLRTLIVDSGPAATVVVPPRSVLEAASYVPPLRIRSAAGRKLRANPMNQVVGIVHEDARAGINLDGPGERERRSGVADVKRRAGAGAKEAVAGGAVPVVVVGGRFKDERAAVERQELRVVDDAGCDRPKALNALGRVVGDRAALDGSAEERHAGGDVVVPGVGDVQHAVVVRRADHADVEDGRR